MKRILVLFFAVAMLTVPATGQEQKEYDDIDIVPHLEDILAPGDKGTVSETMRVTVRNAYTHDGFAFIYGMTCYAHDGGVVEMIKEFDDDNVLVVFSHELPQHGLDCPSQPVATFTLSRKAFTRMVQLHEERPRSAELLHEWKPR